MPDELTSTLELPASAQALSRVRSAYRRFAYEVRHPENHKQLVRFLCVGASGYVLNLVFVPDPGAPAAGGRQVLVRARRRDRRDEQLLLEPSLDVSAKEDHPVGQAVRFFPVSLLVLLFAAGIYTLLVHSVGLEQDTLADGIAWIIATPLSFVVQKLWSFKA